MATPAGESEMQAARDACQKIYQLFMENNYDEVLKYVHPDVVMVNTVCPVDPHPGSEVSTLTGAEEVMQQMKDQAKSFSVEDMTLEHMITGTSSQGPGVYITMMMRASIKNPATGKSVKDHRACHVLHFVDGKMARFEDFADPRPLINCNQAD